MPQHGDALHFQAEWCRVTLASIGDAVITTDSDLRLSQAAVSNVPLVKPVGFQSLQDLLTTLLSPPAKSLGN